MLGTRVGIGKVAINSEPMATSQDVVSLVGIDESAWDKAYICKFLQSKEAYLKSQARGATIKGIKIDTVAELDVPEMPLIEQKRTVSLLNSTLDIIANRKNQLTALDDLVKARFVEMFGDIGLNPHGFKKERLKDSCTVVTGNTPSRAVLGYYGDSIEWIKTDNIVAGQLYPTRAVECLSEEGAQVGRTVDKGAILMACIAGSIASIGRVCVTDRKVAFNQQINAVIPKKYDVSFLYVMLQLAKGYLVEEINMALKGILSKSKLEDKEFIVPPMEQQAEFSAFVTQIDKSKSVIQKSLAETQTLFDSLMQQYFG